MYPSPLSDFQMQKHANSTELKLQRKLNLLIYEYEDLRKQRLSLTRDIEYVVQRAAVLSHHYGRLLDKIAVNPTVKSSKELNMLVAAVEFAEAGIRKDADKVAKENIHLRSQLEIT